MASSTGQSAPEPCTPLCTAASLQERKEEGERSPPLHVAYVHKDHHKDRPSPRCSKLVFGFTFCVQKGGKEKQSGSNYTFLNGLQNRDP